MAATTPTFEDLTAFPNPQDLKTVKEAEAVIVRFKEKMLAAVTSRETELAELHKKNHKYQRKLTTIEETIEALRESLTEPHGVVNELAWYEMYQSKRTSAQATEDMASKLYLFIFASANTP